MGALVLMGARIYNPSTGMFLSIDSVLGGNATQYGYPEDPVNNLDITGLASNGFGGMLSACLRYASAARCGVLLRLLKYIGWYSDNLSGGNAAQKNAGRHFAFMVMSAHYVGTTAARAMGIAHEHNAPKKKDSERDSKNNRYSLGWYSRHKKKAASIIGLFADRGDMVQLYDYGFNLYKNGYMYGYCRKQNRVLPGSKCKS
jgi:hypothetical protein